MKRDTKLNSFKRMDWLKRCFVVVPTPKLYGLIYNAFWFNDVGVAMCKF